ncbi:MAG: energy transducer TonB [Pseudomonadota bacterium]
MRSRPVYPPAARRLGVEGKVKVRILVNTDGKVSACEIVAADPSGSFEDAVTTAVRAWRFQPAKIGGQAVASWLHTTIQFVLQD